MRLALLLCITALASTAKGQLPPADPAAAATAPTQPDAAEMAATPADAAAAAAAGVSAAAATQIIIIGAGVSGLKAGADLASKGYGVTVLEARNRTGGRVWTVNTPSGPVELGAQWIHGEGNSISELATQQGWTMLESSFDTGESYEALTATTSRLLPEKDQKAWEALMGELEDYVESQQERDGTGNGRALSSAVAQFKKDRRITGRKAAGLDAQIDSTWTQEYAADPDELSLNWFDAEKDIKGDDMILAKGYTATVVDSLASAITSKGGKIVLDAHVTAVTYGAGGVTVTAGGKAYKAAAAIVTLPVGVLNANKVKFSPALPSSKTKALGKLGMGTLNKVIIQFPLSAKWPAGNWFERIPLATDNGKWREFFTLRDITKAAGGERAVMVAFNAGKAARYPASVSNATLVAEATAALRAMFGAAGVPDATATWVTRWHDDPWSLGSYSIVRPGAVGNERVKLGEKTGVRLYWAGEATDLSFPSTVPGAYSSGAAAAAQVSQDHKPASR